MTAIIGLSIVAILLCVFLHYEGLRGLAYFVEHVHHAPRRYIIVIILGTITLHILSVGLFAVTYYFAVEIWRISTFGGSFDHTALDYFYYSAQVYTTLGFGDLSPQGDLRVLTSIQPICALILFAWSGSFTYLTINKLWKLHLPH